MSGVTPTASAALTLAPFDSNSRTTAAVSWADEATRSGVRPSCEEALTSAPASSRARVFSRLVTAQCRAVAPELAASRASAPAASNWRTASGTAESRGQHQWRLPEPVLRIRALSGEHAERRQIVGADGLVDSLLGRRLA